ncbi:MAG: hypothetical protein KAH56_00435, partial [Candidatus Krumholzibacteria bacterium]|nr:hypothetical protein [Candidatus Krumholzibacteria bacterium]
DKGSIGGMVFNDLDGNGVKDDGESGIAGIGVTLSGAFEDTAMTDDDGNYLFADLTMGAYTVVCDEVPDFKPTTLPKLQITLATGEVVDTANFGWMDDTSGGKATIKGVVFNDLNGNKVMDEGEPGIEGLKVALDGTSSLLTTSDADGAYWFNELGMGEYKVRSTGPEGWVSTTGEELTIKIETADQVVDNAHFGWMEEGTGGDKAAIGGYVFNDLNGNKVMDQDEPIFTGITVTLSGDATATATTDDKGLYAFTDLSAGDYEVTCSPVDDHTTTTGAVLVVKVPTDVDVIEGVNFGWITGEGLLQ